MVFFIIQCDESGIPTTDLGFQTIDAVKYHRWLKPGISDIEFGYKLVKEMDFEDYIKDGFIPVGSIEFCEEFFHRYKNIHPKAINIPKELMTPEFLDRNVFRVKIGNLNNEIKFDVPKFVKNAIKIKGFADITDTIDSLTLVGERETYLDKERYFKEFIVSDILDIDSEFRGFVYKNKLLDIRRYACGKNLGSFPDINKVQKMVEAWNNSPSAYTIDVAVTKTGKTVLLECHNLWSVGLYGFECGEKLLYMLQAAFNWEVKRG